MPSQGPVLEQMPSQGLVGSQMPSQGQVPEQWTEVEFVLIYPQSLLSKSHRAQKDYLY
jgi:hypothetical protein